MSPIARLRGVIQERGPDHIILDVNGIGFLLYIPISTLEAFGTVGQEAQLYTHLLVREDGPALYGFASQEEFSLFRMLLTVSGVGPKGALALLSTLGVEALAAAIAQGDVERLTRAPGIGRRTAERLALELKGRLGEFAAIAPAARAADDDVLAALLALGYSRAEAEAAAAGVPKDEALPTEERVRLALRGLSKT